MRFLFNELPVSLMNLNNDLRRIRAQKRRELLFMVAFFSDLNCLNGGALSDLTGWPLMSHEYRGTTCLQSNAVNTESNAPPGISIHAL